MSRQQIETAPSSDIACSGVHRRSAPSASAQHSLTRIKDEHETFIIDLVAQKEDVDAIMVLFEHEFPDLLFDYHQLREVVLLYSELEEETERREHTSAPEANLDLPNWTGEHEDFLQRLLEEGEDTDMIVGLFQSEYPDAHFDHATLRAFVSIFVEAREDCEDWPR